MTYPTNFFKLNHTRSFPEVIRAVNHCISQGESVFRWQGPQKSFAAPGDLFFSSATSGETLATTELSDLPESEIRHLNPLNPGRVALLWDKSFLWGYLAVNTLRDLGFHFDLLTAEAVRQGGLNGCQLLVVPGGWASLKSAKLGKHGREELRRFVRSGGAYLGLCGGAGLALQVDEGLGLLPVARKPMAERLPNFSGSILVRPTGSHPLWWGLREAVLLQVWWPSQFALVDPDKIQVLGRYGLPGKDFCVADLNVCDTEATGLTWSNLEKNYQINLDPARLLDEPSILEGNYGKGRVFLSYPHLETPDDTDGNMALFNIWYDLLSTCALSLSPNPNGVNPSHMIEVDEEKLERVLEMGREAEKLMALGESSELWSWRNSWLLQWKRGILGAEFGTIFVLLQGLAKELEHTGGTVSLSTVTTPRQMEALFDKLLKLWKLFKDKGRILLEEEARDLPDRTAEIGAALSTQVRTLRAEIFNCTQCYGSKSYGGIYRQLLSQIDSLLLGALLADLNC